MCAFFFFFLMIRRPPRSTLDRSSAASDVYKRQDPIVTEISKASEFYVAEDYHQNYYNDNSDAMYCQYIISPKIQKIKEKYANKLK